MCRPAYVAWLLTLLAMPLAAQHSGDLITVPNPQDVGSGTLALNANGRMLAAPVLEAEYEVSIGGVLARTRLQQSFQNVTGEWLEGIYIYPLPEGAQVDYLELKSILPVFSAAFCFTKCERHSDSIVLDKVLNK